MSPGPAGELLGLLAGSRKGPRAGQRGGYGSCELGFGQANLSSRWA